MAIFLMGYVTLNRIVVDGIKFGQNRSAGC